MNRNLILHFFIILLRNEFHNHSKILRAIVYHVKIRLIIPRQFLHLFKLLENNCNKILSIQFEVLYYFILKNRQPLSSPIIVRVVRVRVEGVFITRVKLT